MARLDAVVAFRHKRTGKISRVPNTPVMIAAMEGRVDAAKKPIYERATNAPKEARQTVSYSEVLTAEANPKTQRKLKKSEGHVDTEE